MFDSRAYSTGVSLSLTLTIVYTCGHFSHIFTWKRKCRLLYFYIYISLIDPIFTFSLRPRSGGKPFPDMMWDYCCSWAQHNIGHSTSDVEQTPSSVARLKLDGAGGCGRYPLSVTIKERMVCYWTKLLKSSKEKLNKVMT